MDVCDKVTGEDAGAKDAVASMIRRLAHRNANVQLYTLEVGFYIWMMPTNAESYISLQTPSVRTVVPKCIGN